MWPFIRCVFFLCAHWLLTCMMHKPCFSALLVTLMHYTFVHQFELLTFVLLKLCSCHYSYTVICTTLKCVLFACTLIYVCRSNNWMIDATFKSHFPVDATESFSVKSFSLKAFCKSYRIIWYGYLTQMGNKCLL